MKKSDEKRSDGHAGSDSRAPTVFPSAREDAGTEQQKPSTPQTRSATHRLAYADVDFLMRDEREATNKNDRENIIFFIVTIFIHYGIIIILTIIFYFVISSSY